MLSSWHPKIPGTLKLQSDCMTAILVIDQLPQGVVAIYRDVYAIARGLHIPFLVVGATARDLILYYGFGAAIERGTRDIDFGIKISTWDDFHKMSAGLITKGFVQDLQIKHRFHRADADGLPWEIDIVPFGFDEQSSEIAWPPNGDVVMTILGFHEALEHAIQVQIADDTSLNVCSPAAMVALKLVAWTERAPANRQKDASDLLYLIRCYAKIPNVHDSLYSDGLMERWDYDEHLATAEKLGADMIAIMSEATRTFLWSQLFNQQSMVKKLVRDMKLMSHESLDRCNDLIEAFIAGATLEPD
jgi:predicted nucleotidyltransferase